MYLDEILAQHRELARLDERNLKSLISDVVALPRARGFESQLRRESATKLAVIAEIKRRSPSRGALNPD
ncbi:MAG: indole-3-glycerol phosphate synthase, partial [Actinomycetota bacterium]